MTRPGGVSSTDDVDVVVLTALLVEHAAVRAHLSSLATHTDANGTRYETGKIQGGWGRVALASTALDNLAAATVATRAVMWFQPKALVLVGVAFGLADEVMLGDVVVATRVHTYLSGRGSAGGFQPRPTSRRSTSWPLSSGLEKDAREVARNDAWARWSPADETAPAVHFAPLLSGEVVPDAWVGHGATWTAGAYGAVAIDMDSAGVAAAAHHDDFHSVITVRGISDRVGGSKQVTDETDWQRRAADNAAAFAIALAELVAERTGTWPAGTLRHRSERAVDEPNDEIASRLRLQVSMVEQTTGDGPTLLDKPFCVYVAGDDHAAAEALAAAITELFAQQEIEAVPDGPPRIASWFQRFILRAKRSLSTPEIASRLAKVEHALEVVALHDPMSRVNAQQADAMATLLTAAENCGNFVALAGSIVLVKHTDDAGRANVYAKTLSVAEVRAFERNQHLLTSPAQALKHLRLLSAAQDPPPTPTTPSMNGATAPAHDEPPEDLPHIPNPADGPTQSHLLELLGICADFLNTASPAVHHELHAFLIARGYHATAGLPAFLDQLTLTATTQLRQPGNDKGRLFTDPALSEAEP